MGLFIPYYPNNTNNIKSINKTRIVSKIPLNSFFQTDLFCCGGTISWLLLTKF